MDDSMTKLCDMKAELICAAREALCGKLEEVNTHELGHCIIFSFHLLDDIHQMVHPRYWVEAEEWLCNFVADYGVYILQTLKLIGR